MGLVKLLKVPNCSEWRVEREGAARALPGRPCVPCQGMYLIPWQVGTLISCQAGVGHQIAVQKVPRDRVRHDR